MPSTLLLLVTILSEITKFDEYGRIRDNLQRINKLMFEDPAEIVQCLMRMLQEIVSMLQNQFLDTDYSDSQWTPVFQRLLQFILFAYNFKKDIAILNADMELYLFYENSLKIKDSIMNGSDCCTSLDSHLPEQMDSVLKSLRNDLKVLRDHRWSFHPCMGRLIDSLNGVRSRLNQPVIRPNMEYFGHFTYNLD